MTAVIDEDGKSKSIVYCVIMGHKNNGISGYKIPNYLNFGFE